MSYLFRNTSTFTRHNSNSKHYNPTTPSTPLHPPLPPPRKMKTSLFHRHSKTTVPPLPLPSTITEPVLNYSSKHIHSKIVHNYISSCPDNKVLNAPPPSIDPSEQLLPRPRRRTLAQLRAGKSPFLLSYKHHINPTDYPSDECPLCREAVHTTQHLFKCKEIPTDLQPEDLWKNPCETSALLDIWEARLSTST